MTVHVFGSINIDHVHRLPRLPRPGETLADTGYATGLGGKGANQALAAAAAGARVRMAGAVGADGEAALAALAAGGVETDGVARAAEATGHAVILVAEGGENAIVIHAGANATLSRAQLGAALAEARPGDWWLTQNETPLVAESLAAARAAGLRTAHAAAPFDAGSAAAALPHADLLALNEGEAAALGAALGTAPEDLPVPMVLVTMGARGAVLHLRGEGRTVEVPARAVAPVDTTGAGDCFLGTFLGALDRGEAPEAALARAAAAAALSTTRQGAAAAIPTAAEVDAVLARGP